LLLGLNMYGTAFTPERRAIKGDEYLRLLEMHRPRIDWDVESEEAVIEFTTEDGRDAEVWYPTLYSIRYHEPPNPIPLLYVGMRTLTWAVGNDLI
jgi:hypothetical protein